MVRSRCKKPASSRISIVCQNKLAFMGRSSFQRYCYAGKKTAAKSKNRRAWSESTVVGRSNPPVLPNLIWTSVNLTVPAGLKRRRRIDDPVQQRTTFSEIRPRVAFLESTTSCDSSTIRA